MTVSAALVGLIDADLKEQNPSANVIMAKESVRRPHSFAIVQPSSTKRMKLLSDEDEATVLDFISNEIPLTELITLPGFCANEHIIKKPYLCPQCGKILSGLTSYGRHLVSEYQVGILQDSIEFTALIRVMRQFESFETLTTYWLPTIL